MTTAAAGHDRLCLPYREIWFVDFEFRQDRGERPWPVCLVARELCTGREIRLWRDDLLRLERAPFDVGPDALFVAYAAAAEIGCMLELGWRLPANVLDLYFEHKSDTNGLPMLHGNSLLGALAHRGLPHVERQHKEAMRQLVIDQAAWSADQQLAILDYCASDVDALEALFPTMVPHIDLPRALLRGRYSKPVAKMERTGVPIDRPTYDRFLRYRDSVCSALIASVDQHYSVYDGCTFKHDLFARYLASCGIPWPRTRTGRLRTDDDTFRRQAELHPELAALREVRRTLDSMREASLPIGTDGRARCAIKPFMSVTGRNQPPASDFIFALPKWGRGFIKPDLGWGVAYVDWSAQEIAIAAALSGDERIIEHYRSGDPYVAFATAIGMAPHGATKESHPLARAHAKSAFIAVTYGMAAASLALTTGMRMIEAADTLRRHRASYPQFWRWSEQNVTGAMLTSKMASVFEWQRHIGPNVNPRSIGNFPMQANGAEMMRVAAIAATEAGIEVCAPVHDAFLIAAPLDRLDEDVAHMREIMTRAGNAVTGGLDVRTEARVVRYPERYMADGAQPMWNQVMRLLDEVEAKK